MRSLRTFVCLGAVLLGLGSRAQAQTSDPDVRDIPPLVMLVVDTSGSMEEKPACTCPPPGGCSECDVQCSLPNDPITLEPPADKKNKWAVTLEALTGKFKDFSCMDVKRATNYAGKYDEKAPYLYHQPWSCAVGLEKCDYPGPSIQESNGILDNYRDTLQFGLMTYDGEKTYISGVELEPANTFNDSLSNGMEGMWSYGSKKVFKYPGCPEDYAINTGARSISADEGALISLGLKCGSASCDMYQINDAIQSALLKTRPYGGTPIAASLDDLYEHLTNDVPKVDPYLACRDRYAFLITDGAPDKDFRNLKCNCRDAAEDAQGIECDDDPGTDEVAENPDQYSCPYEPAPALAKKLVAKDSSGKRTVEKLFVLGMSVSDPEAREILDDIAESGNSDKSMFADDPNTLRSTLDGVFGPLLNPVSRSVPGFATGLSGVQYQISAGFQVSSSTTSSVAAPWSGLIERRQFICNSKTGEIEAPELEDEDRFHKEINKAGERWLFTALPEAGFKPEWLNDRMGIGTDPEKDHCGKDGCRIVNLESGDITNELLAVADDSKHKEVVQWMSGDPGTPREKKRLGDIYHSSPALVGPPKDEPGDDAYTRFRTEVAAVKERPLVMYIASNDGILHAISVEAFPPKDFPTLTVHPGKTLTPGKELWGFVPPILLKDLKFQLDGHRYNFDATPVVKDVFYKRGASAMETDYHSVLITGMRAGGDSNAYVAMDVTDPFAPKFLWQFWDKDLGRTYGQPEIVQATFKFAALDGDPETVQTRAVAILPGGGGIKGSLGDPESLGCIFADSGSTLSMRKSGSPYTSWRDETALDKDPVQHRTNVQCWKRQGRALYFVDVETGKLIKKVFDADSDPSNGIMFPAPIIGSPTAYPDAVGTIANRGFVVDAAGVIWRIDMSSQDPVPDAGHKGWTMRPFHDIYWDTKSKTAGETTYERPILSLDPQRRLVVIAGTGTMETDAWTKVDADHRIVSLTEVTPAAEPDEPDDWQALINWEHRYVDDEGTGFVPSEFVTGTMALFEGQLFAASFIAAPGGSKACSYGLGRLWSFDYIARDPDAKETNPKFKGWETLYPSALDPKTYAPKRIAIADTGEDSDFKLWNIKKSDAVENLLIQGLSTTQRLSCSVPDDDSDPLNSYFAPNLEEITQTEPPAIWVVAQASQGGKRAGSSLGSVQTKIVRPKTFSRVTSWATNVD